MPTGFVGPTATNPARTPASGEMKHDAVVWSNGAPSTTTAGWLECGICHKSPSNGLDREWAVEPRPARRPARFHAPLAAAASRSRRRASTATPTRGPGELLADVGDRSRCRANVRSTTSPPAALGDCAAATRAAPRRTGRRGRAASFHLAGIDASAQDLPALPRRRAADDDGGLDEHDVHEARRSTTAPRAGITHGDGQDCAGCHTATSTVGVAAASRTAPATLVAATRPCIALPRRAAAHVAACCRSSITP